MPSRRLLVTLLVLVFFTAQFWSPQFTSQSNNSLGSVSDVDIGNSLDDTSTKDEINQFATSANSVSGVLDPVTVEQYGYSSTGILDASTDSGHNEQSSLPIDNTTGWVGSQAELEMWDMKRLYVENGTFDDGVSGSNYYPNTPSSYPYGWDLEWYDTSPGTQNVSTSYVKDDGYIVLENRGELASPGGYVEYRHYDGTYIYWNQTVSNVPYSDNLTLSFMYYYDSGIVSNGTYTIDGWITLDIAINGDYLLELDLLRECPSRNSWIEVTIANITDAASILNLEIGLYIMTMYIDDDYFITYPGADYDGDHELDYGLAQTHRIFLDNISLLSVDQPSYEAVELTFNAGTFSQPITEFSNYGTAIINNPSYWNDETLVVGISSNVSIACDYEVKLLSHNYGDSMWTTQPTKKGVTYTIDAGNSAALTTFMYVGSEGVAIYENFTIELYLPPDWENATIYDPFLNDVTSQCIFSTGSLEIPTSLLNRLGWWQITLESPNYAKAVTSQIRIASSWFDETFFRPSNITRAQIELGTSSETPSSGSSISIDWVMPNGTIWSTDSVSNIDSGIANSSSLTFGGMNTTAGLWEVQAFWENGTEIAYGIDTFNLYHQASANAQYPSIETDHGIVIANQIVLTDADNGDYLLDDSVSMTANWSDTTVAFTQNYAKNWWQADFDTSLVEGDEYTVVVSVTRPYFDQVSVQFTVICTFETTMDITNAGGIPIERGLNEIFTVQLDYDLLNGTGIEEASIDISHTGPGGGFASLNFMEVSNGHYSVDIICDISATYLITITLSKSYCHSASDTFTLIIGETGTSLTSLNGTSDVILFGENYSVVLEYLNSTSDGLIDATLVVESITPSTGLTHTGFTQIGNGLYNITLTPNKVGTFSVLICASLLNHEIQYITFTLTATGIPTVLTALPSSETIAVDQFFTVQLRFQDEGSDLISFENVSVLEFPSGLLISDVVPIAGGLYNFTLTPLQIGTFDIIFRGTADNHLGSSAVFTLIVTEIPTHLVFEGDVSRTTVEFQAPYELTVYYYRSDTIVPVNVDGANISVIVQEPGLVIDVEEFLGYYVITIRGEAIGNWYLTITSNKTDHHFSTKQFLFEVEEIDTSVAGSTPLEALLFGRSYEFSFEYIFEGNSSYIREADIVPFGEGSDWISFIEQGTGIYLVNLTPQALGEHSVVLSFEKTGFDTAIFRLSFNVTRVPISIEIVQGLVAPEISMSTIIVRITESDTGNPVGGVQVYGFIKDPSGVIIDTFAFAETTTTGEYSGQFLMPEAEGLFRLEVTCQASNYVLTSAYIVNLQPERDLGTMLWVTTTRYYPIIFALAAIGFGLVYRRSARKKRIRENKATLAIKRRFDDIRNLLGVIVLHKESGLPVYSKILRDGLEETVISAFITAITSFRGEFNIESSSEEWGLIPISDIVRVISTNKLVCAFITTGNPSPEQRERMIKFAKTVAFIFDDTMEEVPIVVLDHHTTQQFNSLFEDLLDGQLLRTYKLDEVKKFPTTSCASERIARKHGVEFKLEELASEIASCGLEEGRVYKAIMEALDNHFLVTTEDSPFATELLRASDVSHEEF